MKIPCFTICDQGPSSSKVVFDYTQQNIGFTIWITLIQIKLFEKMGPDVVGNSFGDNTQEALAD